MSNNTTGPHHCSNDIVTIEKDVEVGYSLLHQVLLCTNNKILDRRPEFIRVIIKRMQIVKLNLDTGSTFH